MQDVEVSEESVLLSSERACFNNEFLEHEDWNTLSNFQREQLKASDAFTEDEIAVELEHSREVAFFTWYLLKVEGNPENTCRLGVISALLHDVGKGIPGETDLTKTEKAFPFYHHVLGAKIVKDFLPNKTLFGVSLNSDDVEKISSAIESHSSRCGVLHMLKNKGFRPVPDEHTFGYIDESNSVARALSDADNLAQIQLSVLGIGKFLSLVRARILFDGVKSVPQAVTDIAGRCGWLLGESTPIGVDVKNCSLINNVAKKLVLPISQSYQRILTTLKSHNWTESPVSEVLSEELIILKSITQRVLATS